MENRTIAVIDHSINGLFIYNVDKDFDSNSIEVVLHEQGHRLSNCIWGEFDGQINDLRK